MKGNQKVIEQLQMLLESELTGDHITGEVKELQKGKLTFKTDHMGTISIEWDEIGQVTSKGQFDVELASGDITYGALGSGQEAGSVVVHVEEGPPRRLDMAEVVRITPIKETFWGQLDGSLSLGFDFTSANDTTTFTFDFRGERRTRKWLMLARLNALFKDQGEVDSTRRAAFNVQEVRLLSHPRWFVATVGSLETNEELGLDLRGLV